MANPMGLMGTNNPIFQASQNAMEQSGQARNMAVQGIVNNAMQTQQKKVAMQLETWSKLATESKDPNIRKLAFDKLGGLVNTDFSGMNTNLDQAASALADVRKVMNDKTGTYSPDVQKEVWNNYLSTYGTQYVTPEEAKVNQGNIEQGFLEKAQRHIPQQQAATPSLQPQPNETPEQKAGREQALADIKSQQISAYSQGGEVGQAEAKKMLSPEKTAYRVEPAPKGYKSPGGSDTGFVYKDEISGKIVGDAPNPLAATQMKLDVFRTMPTPTPGVFFDREGRKYFKIDEKGQEVPLTSEQVKTLNLQYKEETPTNDIKVMQQSAPAVLFLANQVKKQMETLDLGPVASRWQEFMAGRIGAPNPQFTKFRTDVGLLTTRLMKMHVGSRGGEYIMRHFSDLMDASKQSPENMRAALNEIIDYANETKTPMFSEKTTSANTPSPSISGGNKLDKFLK